MKKKKVRMKQKMQQQKNSKKKKPQESLNKSRPKISKILHLLKKAFGSFIAPALIAVSIFQAIDFIYTGTPEITAENTNSTKPFETLFLVRNRSWVSITDVEFRCMPSPLIADDGHYQIHGIVMIDAKASEILPGQVKQFKCKAELREIMSVNKAHILVSVTYKKFNWPWETPKSEFTWFSNADPPRWIEGQPIN